MSEVLLQRSFWSQSLWLMTLTHFSLWIWKFVEERVAGHFSAFFEGFLQSSQSPDLTWGFDSRGCVYFSLI
jgi:hypothetical protein